MTRSCSISACPAWTGFAALERLRRDHLAVPVVMLSASERARDVKRALDAGAAGFVPKSTRGSVLLSALRLVLSGGVYVPPLMLDAAEAAPTPDLTPRQVEVLRLMARARKRTAVRNAIFGILHRKLLRCPHSELFSEAGREWLLAQNDSDP
ncbi:MAG: response regulator transcription factor [Myxococcota bacterium]|nr:response regulator transcription factor [Myxococcota bacterium]